MSFTKGQQPCADYKGSLDGNGQAVWTNEHQCYRCEVGIVSFCESCHRDHHAGGYETCVPAEELEKTLCTVQVMLMEISCTKGVNSEEYLKWEKFEKHLIRRINNAS